MNAKITALLLVTGLFTAAAYAGNPSALPASSPALIQLPADADKETSAGTTQPLTVNQEILSEYHFAGSYKTADDAARTGSPQVPSRADPFPPQSIDRTVVFEMTPSPIISGDPSGPTSYFPSVTFRFGLGRS